MENNFIQMIKKELSSYCTAVGKAGQLRLVGIISRILGLFLLIFTIVLLVFAVLSFMAVAIISALSYHMPVWAAALIITAVYIALIAVAIVCRKPLFIHPFIRLMTKQIRTEQELEMKTIEADHEVEIQQVRFDNRIENATNNLNFVLNLLSYGWSFLQKLFKK